MELQGYRENLEILQLAFPDRVAISVDECAKIMDLNIKTVYGAIHQKHNPLPVVRMGRKIMIPVGRLARWMCLR